jgi:hypothetical protein
MIAADLHDAGWRVSKNTVAALMAEMGLAARPKKRRKGTTPPGQGRWKAPDLVKRQTSLRVNSSASERFPRRVGAHVTPAVPPATPDLPVPSQFRQSMKRRKNC